MTLTSFDSNWLKYASRTLFDANGLRCCCLSDAPGDRPLYERILWPGYVGARYAESRILFVGAVHNAVELDTAPIRNLALVAQAWASAHGSEKAARAYLDAARAAYIASATQGLSPTGKSWTQGGVWGAFATLLADFGFARDVEAAKASGGPWEYIAFTNWAKCAAPVNGKSTYTRRVPGCKGDVSDRLPIAELDPIAVIVAAGNERLVHALRAARLDVPIVRAFKQRSNELAFPTDIPDKAWHKWRWQIARLYSPMRPGATRGNSGDAAMGRRA